MTQQEQSKTGTSNQFYNLVSIMYHALSGAQTYDTYIRDAEQSGDNDLSFSVKCNKRTRGDLREPGSYLHSEQVS